MVPGEQHLFERSDGIDHRLLCVEPDLLQGSCLTGFDAQIQDRFGVKYILSITTKSVPVMKQTCRFWFCKEDGEPWSPEQIQFVVSFSRFTKGPTALVHCDHGISRSGAGIVLCLMDRHNWGKDDAFDHLKNLDPRARIHEAVWDSIPRRLI